MFKKQYDENDFADALANAHASAAFGPAVPDDKSA